MKIFAYFYTKALVWAEHRHGTKLLVTLSFFEAIFFPIPPDVMLAPMALSQPQKAWRLAFYTTFSSILGGVVGFYLGWFAFDSFFQPLLIDLGYEAKLIHITQWFEEYGIWIVFISGFSPIPYKFFTLTAGALHMAFIPFIAASLVGRGARFFLVAGLMRLGGEKMRDELKRYVDIIGWATVVLGILLYVLLR